MSNRNQRQPPATLPSGFYSAPRIPIPEMEARSAVYYVYSGQPPLALPPPPPPPSAMGGGQGGAAWNQLHRPAAAAAAAREPSGRPSTSSRGAHTPRQSQQSPGRTSHRADDGGSSKGKQQQDGTVRTAGGGFQTVTIQAPGCPVQHFRICVGNDPDDIRAWIQERKRRFPRQKKLNDLLGAYGDSSSSEDEEEAAATPRKDAVAASSSVSFMTTSSAVSAASKDSDPKTKRQAEQIGTVNTYPRGDDHGKRCKLLCRYFAKNGNCTNGVNCTFSHETPVATLAPPTSLMGKLLEQERRREAALTLQLLYMVHVEFDYFQSYSDHVSDETTT